MEDDVHAVIEAYKPHRRHPRLYSPWSNDMFDPAFLELVQEVRNGATAEALVRAGRMEVVTEGVFSFPMLADATCDMIMEEADNYKATGLPVRRPNSMNRYGLILATIGMSPAIEDFQQRLLQPLAALLFPIEGEEFGGHHTFLVQYKASEDLGLDMHTDDSDVTFNVCLGKEFQGAGLTFCGMMGAEDHRQFSATFQHSKGRAVVHLGNKRHGADDIQSGERVNMIVWNHNHAYRSSAAYQHRMHFYQPEDGEPDRRCLSYTHDRDYEAYKEIPPNVQAPPARRNGQRGWCPPPPFCYDGMDPVAPRIVERRTRELQAGRPDGGQQGQQGQPPDAEL